MDLTNSKKCIQKLNYIKMNKARADRYDIYNNLPHGAMSKIGRKLNVSVVLVKFVLEGRRVDHHGIIKEAELMAAINIWKTRFCRLNSEL
jgi:hypothetical protein